MGAEQPVARAAPQLPALLRRQRADLVVQLEDGALPVEQGDDVVELDLSPP
jgi:hypothetical protein